MDKNKCSKSVMDNIANSDIKFHAQGISNFYYEYIQRAKSRFFNNIAQVVKLNSIIEKIKEAIGRVDKANSCLNGIGKLNRLSLLMSTGNFD